MRGIANFGFFLRERIASGISAIIPPIMTAHAFESAPSVAAALFGGRAALLPSVTEVFELELALLELGQLAPREAVERGAYFMEVGGKPTRHFSMCAANGVAREGQSAMTRDYFEAGRFSTGYSTHSLFPYRGKFHPQLAKALINIIGVRPGHILLDPMCGSGTTNLEAALLGINSVAVDKSPFCRLMTRVKRESLDIARKDVESLPARADELFAFFGGQGVAQKYSKVRDEKKRRVFGLSMLAYLDAMGYAERVKKSGHRELFAKVLARYAATVGRALDFLPRDGLGNVDIPENGDVLDIPLPDKSVDGIITSPPYSFAIDYAANDSPQLSYLGCDIAALREEMVGLRGRGKAARLENYFADMNHACAEMGRVLKRGKHCVIVIGSNTNQTGGVRLDGKVTEGCEAAGMNLIRTVLKPIKGMRNTMSEEHILFFRKNGGKRQ